MIVTISTPDQVFFEQLIVFLTSLEQNSPGHKVYVCLVDYPTDLQVQLRKAFPEVRFENRSADLIDQRGIGLILLRIRLVYELMEKLNEAISWIDTDVIIRAPLERFVSVESNHLKILYRGFWVRKKIKFNAGVFSIGSGSTSLKFLERWHQRLIDNAKWGRGQLELYRTYQEFKPMITIDPLDLKYNDLGGRKDSFSPDSVIWHAKKSHLLNPRFNSEFQRYLDKGSKLLVSG